MHSSTQLIYYTIFLSDCLLLLLVSTCVSCCDLIHFAERAVGPQERRPLPGLHDQFGFRQRLGGPDSHGVLQRYHLLTWLQTPNKCLIDS